MDLPFSSPSFDAVVDGVGGAALGALKATLADAWHALTPEEQRDATKLLYALGRAHLLELAGFDVSKVLPILQAAFDQWAVVGKQVVVDGIRTVAREGFGLAGAFAEGAVEAFLKRGAP